MATSVLDQLSSKNNKGTLWNILYEKGVFHKLTNNDLENVKMMFENTINQYKPAKNARANNLRLIDLNKDILTILINKIEQYSVNNASVVQQQQQQQPHNPQLNYLEQPTLVTSKEITNERLRQFEQGLYLKEQEMQSVMKLKKPEDIDFKDTNDDPPLEMEKSLQSMIERRRNDFNQVINEGEKNKAENWINNNNNNNNIPPTSTVKKVSFEDNSETVDTSLDEDVPDFFNKLKQKTEHEQIMDKLQELSDIQKQILRLVLPPPEPAAPTAATEKL